MCPDCRGGPGPRMTLPGWHFCCLDEGKWQRAVECCGYFPGGGLFRRHPQNVHLQSKVTPEHLHPSHCRPARHHQSVNLTIGHCGIPPLNYSTSTRGHGFMVLSTVSLLIFAEPSRGACSWTKVYDGKTKVRKEVL